jgi:hypothetical protein
MAQYTWSTPTQIKNCLDPSLAQDAATKNYVDTTVSQGGTYGNANVAGYLPTYTGNLISLTGNVITTANVSGSYLLGNIAVATGFPSITSNITTVANISASYVLGNGAFLTGISGYANANVANYIPTYTGNIANVLMVNSRENVTIVGANTTVTFDVLTSAIQFQTAAATGATTVNFRGNSTTTLNTMLAVGQSVTVTYVMTTGATGYVVSTVQVDGTTQTVKYPGGVSPTPIASATNSFTYTIIKTAATPTYTVLGTQTGYA